MNSETRLQRKLSCTGGGSDSPPDIFGFVRRETVTSGLTVGCGPEYWSAPSPARNAHLVACLSTRPADGKSGKSQSKVYTNYFGEE